MKEPWVLADINLWLATLVERHPHHRSAIAWWTEWALPKQARVAFCRLTQLGLMRLLTNRRIMGDQIRTAGQAFSDYTELIDQRPVAFAKEPAGIDRLLKSHCGVGGSSPSFWTNSYLAAFALAADMHLATFDRGFRKFPKLRLQLLD